MPSESIPSSTGLRLARMVERRGSDRITIPTCQHCGGADTAVATRTDYVVYIRCAACLQVWSVPKPGNKALGT